MTFLEKLRLIFTFGQGVAMPMPELDNIDDPFELFGKWFEDAKKSGILLPEAMSVATVSEQGQPSTRMVLLKEWDQSGFVFYTNYGSRKCQDMTHNGKIALLFHWGVLQRQVRIEGVVEKVSAEQSKAYFDSRDRGSKIGAWASKQSEKVASKEELAQRVKEYEEAFKGQEVPYPEFWGGWRIKPHMIEFWQGRASRLHDRLCFEKHDDVWERFKRNP
ncbi:pyridoxamine 5'-phosphate oxidase [Thalassotalea agarivorans]|uniref:Pyridoxine/pyridoxamine 5'-phosphate oxidase n=1 Tax=Thalassotalea agarivorans TaxID=349064 RepID=A0A1H9ZCL9_THASX|nr:pyridoxamine 5'-phosphate oxidase [Thalassotalea agarivorans]SES79081.1 Pyridoxamine 5'-phosphate oxidase [Thalassotalea agarivorans]